MPVTHQNRWIASQLAIISGEELQALVAAGRSNYKIASVAGSTAAWITYLRAQAVPPGAVPRPVNWAGLSSGLGRIAYTGIEGGYTAGAAIWPRGDIL